MAEHANTTELPISAIKFTQLQKEYMELAEFVVILETLSAMETLLLGCVKRRECHGRNNLHSYNEAGEYLDDLLTSVQDVKEEINMTLKAYKPKNKSEAQQLSSLLLKLAAEEQELDLTTIHALFPNFFTIC